MREATGGALLFKIVLILLTVYIFFMAVVINFAKAYKVKNSLLDYIEEHEGINDPEVIAEQARLLGYSGDIRLCRTESIKGRYYELEVYAIFQLPFVEQRLKLPVSGSTRIIEVTGLSPSEVDSIGVC